jgi:hypothetical protein
MAAGARDLAFEMRGSTDSPEPSIRAKSPKADFPAPSLLFEQV